MMITTRDIDREVADISRMIGYAVNMALHPHLSVADIDSTPVTGFAYSHAVRRMIDSMKQQGGWRNEAA
ncbi:MAG: hypothetical protein ACLRVN_02890 [Butyricicoccus sp.]